MRVLLYAFIALALSSCFERGDCVVNNTNLIKINLKKKSDNSAYSIALTTIEINGVSYDMNATVSSLQLPVSPYQSETSFVLNYGAEQKKIVFSYRNLTIVPSADCGAVVYQMDVKVKETTYGPTSIRKINDKLLKNATVNFEIYF